MAAYETRTKTTIRHEYVIPSPANWAEVNKAFSAVAAELEDKGWNCFDDSVMVRGNEEEIVIYWEEEAK